MHKKSRNIKVAIFLSLLCIISILSVRALYREIQSKHLSIAIKHPKYTISFKANGGTGNMEDQIFKYSESKALSTNTFTKDEYIFDSWNTKTDGSGTSYSDEQIISNLSSVDGTTINLYAQWIEADDKVARIGDNYYTSLQEAVDDVSGDEQITIVLLKSTDESITVNSGKNILFNFQNYTVRSTTAASTIKNYGNVKIYNGIITNTAAGTNALIDNYSTGNLEVSGGTIISLGTKQAIYNEGGTVHINGNVNISSKASGKYDNVERATVQNRQNGKMYITSGTITNSVGSAVSLNSGTVEIGTKNSDPDSSSLLIQGKTYGVYNNTPFKFYDGKIQGKTQAIFNEEKIGDVERGYYINKTTEDSYKTATLAAALIVKFNGNGGTSSVSEKYIEAGQAIGTLPTATRTNYIFDGWYTAASGGEIITSSTIISENTEFFAHWHQEEVALINNKKYYSLQSAVNAVPLTDEETTIILLKNVNENITVNANKNIVFDLQNYTLKSSKNSPVITNKGKIKLINGTIEQTFGYAAINNEENGEINMTGGSIISTGSRACIYNKDNSSATISGDAYLRSNASGQFTEKSVVYYRGTIMNLTSTSSTVLTSGTVISTEGYGISSVGVLTIGIKGDGSISSTSPIIIGKTYGIKNTDTFNFYDGIIKGITDTIDGTITELEDSTTLVNGTEQIDGSTYKTVHLEN